MKVPMYDLRREYLAEREIWLSIFDEVCRSAQFAGGAFVDGFENAFGAYLDGVSVGAVGNGTDALILALRALDVGAGDEVIVPSATFTATPGAVALIGAKPVFADCDPETWEISPDTVRPLIGPKTKAVIGVHLYGGMFDAPALRALCEENGLYLIEDCAQAAGAALNGIPAGLFGDAACFSFYPTKNLAAFGEGGAVCSRNADLIARVRSLRNHAHTPRGDFSELAGNMRMQGLQGAVLTHKLKNLPDFLKGKSKIAGIYRAALEGHPALRPQKTLPGCAHAYHLFAVEADDRARFIAFMASRGIETSVQYPIPCHLQQAFAGPERPAVLPVTERLFSRCVSVPSYPLLTEGEILAVAEALRAYR